MKRQNPSWVDLSQTHKLNEESYMAINKGYRID